MSEEGDKRRSALLRMKMFMGSFFILGFAILLCSGLSTNYYVKRATGVQYFWGGFIVGPMAIINSMLLGNVLVGAMGKSADNDDIKKIASRISCQYSMSTLLFPACLIGSIFTGIWGINYDVEGGQLSTNRALAAVILIGILVFLVNLVAVCTIRTYGKYFDVVFGRKGGHMASVSTNAPNNGGAIRSNESGLVIQYNVNVISSDNNRQNVNQIEQENRLFQQQLAVQQHMISQQKQQEQQHFTGGVYRPPPSPYSEIDPAYPPITSFPEPSAPPL